MRHKDMLSCGQLLHDVKLPMLERALKLQRLERAVRALLPADLAAHCRVMNLKNECLVLAAPSSAWAARLRFASAALVTQLHDRYALPLRDVQVRVQPETSAIPEVNRPRATLSLASGTLLAQTAQTLNHAALREALYRLAAKARNF
jgi:hypothetical protein